MFRCRHKEKKCDKNVSVFERSMCITQRKIVSNYCFKQCSNKLLFTKYCVFWYHLLLFRIMEIFHLIIRRKICEFYPLSRMTTFHLAVNIIIKRFTYRIIYENFMGTKNISLWNIQVPEFWKLSASM